MIKIKHIIALVVPLVVGFWVNRLSKSSLSIRNEESAYPEFMPYLDEPLKLAELCTDDFHRARLTGESAFDLIEFEGQNRKILIPGKDGLTKFTNFELMALNTLCIMAKATYLGNYPPISFDDCNLGYKFTEENEKTFENYNGDIKIASEMYAVYNDIKYLDGKKSNTETYEDLILKLTAKPMEKDEYGNIFFSSKEFAEMKRINECAHDLWPNCFANLCSSTISKNS